VLVIESYVYMEHSKGQNLMSLQVACMHCDGITTTDNPLTTVRAGLYNHLADPDYAQARQVVNENKTAGVAQCGRGPAQINEQDLSQELIAKLPQRAAIKHQTNRKPCPSSSASQKSKSLDKLFYFAP